MAKQLKKLREDDFYNTAITMTEDKHTTMAKNNATNKQRVSIDTVHASNLGPSPRILQRGRNVGYAMSATFQRAIRNL